MSGNQFYNEIPPPGFDEYFDLTNGVPIIRENIESTRFRGALVYEAHPEKPEMSGQFTQVYVDPKGIVKLFIEQPQGIAIFIKPKTDITDINDNFTKSTNTFMTQNNLSQEDINYICRAFLTSLLDKLFKFVSKNDRPQFTKNKKKIIQMLKAPVFMMTIVEGMISLDDINKNQDPRYKDEIKILYLTVPLKKQKTAASAAMAAPPPPASAAMAAPPPPAAVYKFTAPLPASAAPSTAAPATAAPATAEYKFTAPLPATAAPSTAATAAETRRGTKRQLRPRGGKSKRNKSKKGTKRRNKKDKRKTRKYK